MPYIGQSPTQVAFLTDTFSGNGSTTAFTMSVAPATTTSVLVAISGVLQDPSTYSVSGTTLTFSAAPPSGTGNISARYLGIPASGVTTTAYRTITEFTATAGQTTFTPPSYTVGFINVYRNGVLLGSADYTATNGTTVVLASGATAGDLVTVESFLVSSVLNAIPATAGSVGSTYLASNLTLNGYVSTPNRPAFHAVCSGSSAQLSGSTLLFQIAKVNVGSNYNTSTSTFTAPVAGTYFFYGSVMANTGTGRLYWRMSKNGSDTGYMQAGGDSSNYGEWYGSMTITLAVGDYINMVLSQGTPYTGNVQEQYFGGYLLG